MRRALLVVAALASVAHARAAKVTAITPSTVYVDAGTADGLRAGTSWQATIDGRAATVRVVAAASHDAVLEVDGAKLAIGGTIDLPAAAAPPPPVAVRPPPQPLPPWRPVPDAMQEVQVAAQHEQPGEAAAPAHTIVTGEIALSAFLAGDLSKDSSTSWQDLALSSQLTVIDGPWRYDHLVEARLAGSPELFNAPLQHAQARFDVYLFRLQYSDPRYAIALGRQPSATLSELGVVDGAHGSVNLGGGTQLEAFAGLRPATDLAMALIPHAGADLGWQTATASGTHARLDAGIAIDEYKGSLDRAAAAASASISTKTLVLHGDAVVDLASDASGKGGRLTRAAGFLRNRRGKLTAGLSAGYDQPFLDRAFVEEIPDIVYGPRSFAGGELEYAWRPGLTIGTTARVERGDGFTSGYGDVLATWIQSRMRYTLAPHVIIGSLVDETGVRAGVGFPLWRGDLDLDGSFDRVWANGERAWAGLGRTAYSLSFWQRWRATGSLEFAGGDGPPRLFVFLLLGYRL